MLNDNIVLEGPEVVAMCEMAARAAKKAAARARSVRQLSEQLLGPHGAPRAAVVVVIVMGN